MAKIKVATLSLLIVLLLTSFKIYPDKKQYLLMGMGVVELFTSEGNASCPPADETLIRLSKEFAGKPVYLLSFHVDYWEIKAGKTLIATTPLPNVSATTTRYFIPMLIRHRLFLMVSRK